MFDFERNYCYIIINDRTKVSEEAAFDKAVPVMIGKLS